MWMRRPDAGHCAAVGEALARMHLAGADFSGKRRNALSVTGWRPLFEQAADRADSVQHGMRAMIETELGQLETAWPRDLPQGVIHADLFPDNVFFLERQTFRPDRLLFRLHRHARFRHRHLPQRLVLRARSFLQRHQGPATC